MVKIINSSQLKMNVFFKTGKVNFYGKEKKTRQADSQQESNVARNDNISI